MPSTPSIHELLLQWEEAREQGHSLSAEELCRDCPDALPEVAARIRTLEAFYERVLPAEEPSTWPPLAEPQPVAPEPARYPAVPGYDIEGELGHGGMGIVYSAWQCSPRRRVALKMILGGRAGPDERARLLREAQAQADLEHPNVVRVYEVGEHEGSPFFSLELVEGGSLDQKIDGTPQPARQAAAWLEPLARALHAAHQRGIVHRDLKPSNVLLTADDTPKLTDFGLAKVLEVSAAEAHAAGLTPSGAILGTPSYMAPEQAAGKTREVGPAADVYGLGAILYECLTGRPPFKGETLLDTLQQVVTQEPVPPRRLNDKVPRDLETICLKCLEKEPRKRYGSAGELADDLGRFQRSEPVRARPVGRLGRAWRWGKRNPREAAIALLVLVLVLAGGGFSVWWKQQQDERRQQHDQLVGAVQDHLDRAEQLRNAEQWDQARQALDRAEARLADDGPTGLHERLQGLREQLDAVRQLDHARMQRLVLVDNEFDGAGADRAYQGVFAGLDLDPLGPDPARVAERIARTPLRKQLAVALDHWAFVKYQLGSSDEERLLAVARLVDVDPWRQQLRDPSVRKASAKLQRLAEDEEVLKQPPTNLLLLYSLLKGAQSPEAAGVLLRQAQQHHPTDFWSSFELGTHLHGQKSSNKEEALGYYRAALALQPHSVAVYNNFGLLLADQKKPVEAEAAFRKALQLQPDFTGAWNNLGLLLADQKKPVEAEAAFRKALQLQPDYAKAWTNLGLLLKDQQKPVEAEAAFRKALQLQPDYAKAWNNLGALLKDQKKPVEAEAAFRKALQLQPDYAPAWTNLGAVLDEQQRPAQAEVAFRKAIEHQPDYVPARYNLGNLLRHQKKPAEAEAAYRKALQLQPDYAKAWYNLGLLLADQKKPVEAEAAFRKALQLQPDHAQAWNNLGVLLKDQNKLEEAEAAYRKALQFQPNDALAWYNLGILLQEQNKPVEAEVAFRKALQLQPDYAKAWNNLGALLKDQKKPVEAEAAHRKALQFQPNDALAWYNLGILLQAQQKPAEAEAAYRKALQLQPDCAEAHCNLGHVLRKQGRFAEAIASLKKGHDLGSRNPGWPYSSAQWVRRAEWLGELDAKLPAILKGETKPDAAELIELARLCQHYKQFHAAAARFYRDAFAAQPKFADDIRSNRRYDAACAAALAGCGQGKDADQTDEKERPRFRGQALNWLRADLAAWSAQLKDYLEKAAAGVQQKMQHWQQDADLAGVRDADALAKLPEDERQPWRQLWDDVEALRQRAVAPKQP